MNTFNAQFRVQLTIEKGNMSRSRKVNLTIIKSEDILCAQVPYDKNGQLIEG